ncbi:hypothetical protein ABPG75_006872 [Micractinium tetrahymenae]
MPCSMHRCRALLVLLTYLKTHARLARALRAAPGLHPGMTRHAAVPAPARRAPAALQPLRTACIRRPDGCWRGGRPVAAAAGTPPPGREPSPAPRPSLPAPSAWVLSAPGPVARAHSTLLGMLKSAYQMYGKSALTAIQSLPGGPGMRVSREDLEHHQRMAWYRRKIAENRRRAAELMGEDSEQPDSSDDEDEARTSSAPTRGGGGLVRTAARGQPPKPQVPAPGPRPAPLVWPPPAPDTPPATASTRMAAAEASATAAAAWARTAAAREAAAEAAAERTDSQPAAQHTGDAEAWEWAAAAWHAAHDALEAARQASPDCPAVHDAEAAVQAARALKAQRQAWRDG